MRQTNPSELSHVLVRALESSGNKAELLTEAVFDPRKILIEHDADTTEIWIYADCLFPKKDQTESKNPNLYMPLMSTMYGRNFNGPTAIVGYDPVSGGFTGFDAYGYQTPSEGGRSLFVSRNSIVLALADGISFERKRWGGYAVSLREDHLLNYVFNSADMFDWTAAEEIIKLLRAASTMIRMPWDEIEKVPLDRRKKVRKFIRETLQANFRDKVRKAYDNRCAVTGARLRLNDACHIYPARFPDSPYVVHNGILLQPTFHRAFDTSLIYLDLDYAMKINPNHRDELAYEDMDDGLEEIAGRIGKRLTFLPKKQADWPNTDMIIIGKEKRGVNT